MNDSPLVSVLISSYNHENYVQETIKSIINQTYQNIELIIIDDGSKDSTWEKIQEMKTECEKRFTNISFETKENAGASKNLNRLIPIANGEYIYIIASDDMAKPEAIMMEVEFLKHNKEYAIAGGDCEFIDSNGLRCYKDKDGELTYDIKKAKFKTASKQFGYKNSRFKEENFGKYETLYLGNYIPNGFLIRKSIFDKIGPFIPEAPLEDWWMMLQVSKYSKMKFIDKVLFSYRWHGKNTMANLEKMNNITDKTFEYELNLLSKGDFKEGLLINPAEILKNGVCYKKQGIPFVFEILAFKKGFKKVKIFKLFNIKIAETIKERK